MRAAVGYSELPGSAAAGEEAVRNAIGMSGRDDPCDLILLFCTARHDQQAMRGAVSAVAGSSVPIYGGGAVGVITNDAYGYAGDQAGVVCLWLDGVSCNVLTDDGLLDGEKDTGFRLGQALARLNVAADSPVMLLYEAVGGKDDSGVRLMMADWILAGMEKALGFLPTLTGAGLMGDHICTPTDQFTGGGIGRHTASAFVFGGDIRMDSVIMHGCLPASEYYTVTKADGPVILEINHQPALAFVDALVGPAIQPEQYPFFLLFGVNSGERWAGYNEDNYASRLCLGTDRERNGIVMFEPDMVEGTEFQLMFRSIDLDYMKPKIESAFRNLNGREPVFAIYIDCAGRCAGYNGNDLEDALFLQQIVAGRVPMLGIYTGVEIAPVAGRPRVLDWSGVFCLFSQGGSDAAETAIRSETAHGPAPLPETDRGTPIDVWRVLCEQNAARALALDMQALALRYELELKRRGFHLISELAVSLRQSDNYNDIFIHVAQRVNAALNMQKTVVLLSDGMGKFVPAVLQGFPPEEQDRLRGRTVHIPDELLNLQPVIVTSDHFPECLVRLREDYGLPFFIASPIFLQNEMTALLITGRTTEQEPYLTRLGVGDLETVHAITELLGAVLVRLHLNDILLEAQTDGLTGLWNRNTFRHMVDRYLNGDGNSGAFMMIDVDYFKSVNDIYGHIAGDKLLKACADAMRNALRESDIVGRQGGDEFAVFCRGIKDDAAAAKKAAQLAAICKHIIPDGGSKHITVSIGVAMLPRDGVTFQELYNNADVSLYRAKAQGRNRFVLFDPDGP